MIHSPSQGKRIHFLYLCFTADNSVAWCARSFLEKMYCRSLSCASHFAHTFTFASSSLDLSYTSYRDPISKCSRAVPL